MNEKEKVEAIEGFGDVECRRTVNGIWTNVPRRITKHSPDGFEWGYGGSGPADFALNILSVYIGQAAAEAGGLYHDFKFQFIAAIPYEGGIIKRDYIVEWLEDKRVEQGL